MLNLDTELLAKLDLHLFFANQFRMRAGPRLQDSLKREVRDDLALQDVDLTIAFQYAVHRLDMDPFRGSKECWDPTFSPGPIDCGITSLASISEYHAAKQEIPLMCQVRVLDVSQTYALSQSKPQRLGACRKRA